MPKSLRENKENRIIPSSLHERNPFMSLQNELDRAINRIGNFTGWFEPSQFLSEHFEDLSIAPAMDIVDDKDQFKAEFEMPGIDEKDVKVTINEGVLTVKAEKSRSKQNTDKNYRMREISYGSYERRVLLPETVDTSKATASFKKGMLWISIPKKSGMLKQSREIPVEKKQ